MAWPDPQFLLMRAFVARNLLAPPPRREERERPRGTTLGGSHSADDRLTGSCSHINRILVELGLPGDGTHNRRVLAVLSSLRGASASVGGGS